MAGLLSGALAGAIGGAGQAIQQNAQGQIEQRRQEALRKVDHKYAMSRQANQQAFTTSEREAGQQFTAEQGEIGREHDITRLDRQETAADRRARMQVEASNYRTNAGLMQRGQDAEGNAAWFNPATGQRVEAPEGWSPVREGPDAKGDDFRFNNLYISQVNDRIESLEVAIANPGRMNWSAAEVSAARAELRQLESDRDAAIQRLRERHTSSAGSGAAGGSQPPPLLAKPSPGTDAFDPEAWVNQNLR